MARYSDAPISVPPPHPPPTPPPPPPTPPPPPPPGLGLITVLISATQDTAPAQARRPAQLQGLDPSRSSRSPTSCVPRSRRRSPGSERTRWRSRCSPDNPRTVAALATQAGLDVGEPVAGSALDGLDEQALDRLVARMTVFGRVAPEHKERIVTSLRRQGRYVAMIGDGVNGARALKAAQVGVAMRSGSAVTHDVADIVLVDDPPSVRAGKSSTGSRRRCTSSSQRVATQGVVILAVTMLGLGFPYSPTQVGLTLFTVGVPTLFLTLWARSTPPDPHLLSNLARFAIPAAIVTGGFATAVYAFLYESVTQFIGPAGPRPRRSATSRATRG